MRSALDPYLDFEPAPEDLTSVPADELARIIDAAREVEALTAAGVREAKSWARTVRTAAEEVLAKRSA